MLHRRNTAVNWIQYPKWQTYIGRSVPLVSAADWLNSQSADRLNIRSADWPVPRSSGDIKQADQPTLQKPSAPSPLIQDTIHTTYTHTNNHTIQHTRTIINTNIMRSPATTINIRIKPAQRLQKLSYLHLLTGCFMKISLQSSEQNVIVIIAVGNHKFINNWYDYPWNALIYWM